MDNTRKHWWVAGLALGTAAVGFTLQRRYHQQRLKLASQVHDVTQRAVQRLGVPATSQFIQVGDVQLHAVVAGPEDGPLALLLHGFPECWYSWRSQIPVLAHNGYRVVVPDQRGYNLSDKPRRVRNYQIDYLTADIMGLIHALGRERTVIVAHDWGGVAAWRFAMDYPDAIERLVIMNAPHPVPFAKALNSDWSQRFRSWYVLCFQLPWLPETLLTLSPRATARLFFRRTAVRHASFSDVDLEIMAVALAQPGAMRTMIHWYRATFRYRPAKRVSIIEVPTLLIWAEDDVALGKPLTYGLERWVPDLEIHYIPRCGHWVQNEAAGEVNEQMLDFLGKAS